MLSKTGSSTDTRTQALASGDNAAKAAALITKAAGSGDFEATLRKLLVPNSENKISEEELFAGLVQERLTDLKGAEAGKQYGDLLTQQKQQLKKPDGYCSYEDAAKGALRAMRSSGALSEDEADQIYTTAFNSAQLDGNLDVLYDGRGGPGDPTMAVEELEKALLSARMVVDKIAAGAETLDLRSLDEPSNTKPGAAASPLPGAPGRGWPGGAAPGSSSQPSGTVMDGPNGFLFKPESDNDGRLAILTPEAVAQEVTGCVLRVENGGVIEEGRFTSFGDLGTRGKYSFSKRGSDYPRNLTVDLQLSDGSVLSYLIPDPSQRYD